MITIPITCQEFPNASPNSVMALVSISMKPAPRKKKGAVPNCGRATRNREKINNERASTSTPMIKYDTG